MWPMRRILKYSVIGGTAVGTLISLRANQYQFDSIGIVRLSRAAISVFEIASMYKEKLYKHNLDKYSPEYLKLKSECHELGAKKLLELCCTNRGVYIKVGQHVGALDYLMPKEYVQTMRVLHSRAPTNSIEDVYRVIKEDLKKHPNEIFESIDPEPLGTASLAQVHRAVLKDGRTVAVKVQHPYVRGNAAVDMKTMEVLVKIVSYIFPDFKFQWLVDETKKNIPQELDFALEGRNAEKVAELLKDFKWLKIPKVYWELSTPRVLTMEFVEGGQVNDLKYIQENKIDPYEISRKLGRLYSQMIFINGFVHSDPHPGNILVKKSPTGVDIILLDHGLYANISDDLRYNYSRLWLSILNKDRKGMRLHSGKLGIQGNMYGLFTCMITGRSWDTIMGGIQQTKLSTGERDLLQREFPNLLPDISGILETVNRQMLLILKTNDLMRGIEYTLKTQQQMISFMVMSKCCIKSVFEERKRNADGKLNRFKIGFKERWTIFKLTLYYAYQGMMNLALFTTIRHMIAYS